VVDGAVERHGLEVLPVAPLFPEVPRIEQRSYAQLWPHRHGTDAMFMALLRRS
jgi:16S rRNA (cytosine967-C5)-methyltransferase